MTTTSAILLGIIGLLLGGVLFRRGGGRSKAGPILKERDKALQENKENVRKDVERLEERREDALARPHVSDALNDLIRKGDL